MHKAGQKIPAGVFGIVLAGLRAPLLPQSGRMADFAKMNEIWDAWVPQGHTPARACGEAKLATPDYLVEFIVVAAKP